MKDIKVFDKNAAEVSTIELNDAVFDVEVSKQALFDSVIAQQAAARQGTHAVKNRSAVAGGAAKPWRQKGTGRARIGTIRAPHWVGGGVVFGPNTNRNYKLKINKKVKQLALKSALTQRLRDNDLLVINEYALDAPKTKDALALLKAFSVEKKLLFIDDNLNINVAKSFNNIKNSKVITTEELNVFDLLNANKIVVTTKAIKDIEGRLA